MSTNKRIWAQTEAYEAQTEAYERISGLFTTARFGLDWYVGHNSRLWS